MSLVTWEDEFYPIEASKVPPGEALEHSLRKWIGLRASERRKHAVVAENRGLPVLRDPGFTGNSRLHSLRIDSTSCALCVHHEGFRHNEVGGQCFWCPLYMARGGVRCDRTKKRESMSPWSRWYADCDPEPMIRWLRLAKKLTEAEAIDRTA